MVEFLRKFENRSIKVVQDNSILITKSINLHLFTLILYGVGVRCDFDIFKLTASAQSIYREVNDQVNFNYFYTLFPSNLVQFDHN